MSVRDFNDANIAFYRIQSAGAAYDLVLPFEADSIEWWNNTTYGTNDSTLQGIWFPWLTDAVGGGLIISRGTTDLTSSIATTTGITELDDGVGFTDNHLTPTAIDGTTGVVTTAANTLVTGQFLRATNFRATPVASATGMYALNNLLWEVEVLSSTTFQLFYPQTNRTIPFNAVGQVAFVNNGIAQFTLAGQTLYTENPAPVFGYTLGTGVMGADNDIIIIRAMKGNVSVNLGDVA